MRVTVGPCEYFRDHAFGQFAASLVLFLDNSDELSNFDVASVIS